MNDTEPPERRSSLLARLLLALASAALTLLALELGLRLVGPLGPEFVLDVEINEMPPQLFDPDPALGYRARPNAERFCNHISRHPGGDLAPEIQVGCFVGVCVL